MKTLGIVLLLAAVALGVLVGFTTLPAGGALCW